MEKTFKKIKGLLIGGLVSSVVLSFVYFLVFVVFLFAYGFAAVIGAVIVAMFGGDPETVTIDPTAQVWLTLILILSVATLLMIVLYIVALVLSRKYQEKGKRTAVGILAIIANVPTIFVPVGLIAGIKSLKAKEENPVNEPAPQADE